MRDEDVDITRVVQNPAIKIALVTVTAVTGALGFAAAALDLRPALDSVGGFAVFSISFVLLGIIVTTFVGVYLAAQRASKRTIKTLQDKSDGYESRALELQTQSAVLSEQNTRLSQEVHALNTRKALPDTHQRFEEIEKKVIKLGWIPFHPTLRYDETAGEWSGPGPDILGAVFSDRVNYHPMRANWNNIISGLTQGLYDVVATPLYDIRERRTDVEFTLPIFYADIGIFVSKDNHRVFEGYLGGRHDLTFDAALQLLSPHAGEMKFCVNRGELQDKMVTKYFKGATVRDTDSLEFSVAAALSAMATGDEAYSSDLYFCERVQGEGHREFGKKLVNILKGGQLLFPVGFAIRKGDDTLRKFMNLRLLSIDGENDSGIKRQLMKSATGIVAAPLLNKIDQYFLRHRDPVAASPTAAEDENNIFHFRK